MQISAQVSEPAKNIELVLIQVSRRSRFWKRVWYSWHLK